MNTKRIVGDAIIYLILAVMSVIWLAPIAWLVLQSFGVSGGQADKMLFIPSTFGFQNYEGLFINKFWNGSAFSTKFERAYALFPYTMPSGEVLLGSFLNTLIVALGTMVLSTLLTLMTAYGLSRLRFRGRQLIMRICLIMGMFPGFLGVMILYWMFRGLGVPMSLFTLILVYSAGAGAGYYIAKGFFDTISKQIDEAAMIDGATRLQIFYKITLPLAKPIVVYQALTAFMGPWGEYITANYFIRGQAQFMTVAPQLYDIITGTINASDYWGWFCAASVIIAIPVSILFVFMQKYYVSGVTGGSVKG